MDECLFEDPVCHTNATCSNTYGHYFCNCTTGFTGNGLECNGMLVNKIITPLTEPSLIDTDECLLELDSCHSNATCHNSVGSYTCVCDTGFTGDGFNCTG